MNNEKKINIALVDDHVLLLQILADYLMQIDNTFHVLITATNGIDLLNKISKSLAKPDICLVDINMPVMNGYETIRALKTKWPEIKAIALT